MSSGPAETPDAEAPGAQTQDAGAHAAVSPGDPVPGRSPEGHGASATTAPEQPEQPRPEQEGAVRRPLPHATMVLLTIAGVWLSVTLLREVQSIIAPVFLALNFLIVVYPMFAWLSRRSVPKVLASLLAGASVFGILALFAWGVAYCAGQSVAMLLSYSDDYRHLYEQGLGLLQRLGITQDTVVAKLRKIDPSSVVSVAQGLFTSFSSALSLMSMLVLSLIFMVMDLGSVPERVAAMSDGHQRFVDALRRFAHGIRSYWVVTTVFGLIVAVLDWGALLAIGVKLALVWALLSFLTNYIPNIGFVVGLVPPTLVALFDHGVTRAILVVAAYCVLNFVVQSIIQPKFTGSAIGITATVSFISLFFWTWVLGALGALVALPCTLLVKSMIIDLDPNSRWVNALVAADPRATD